MTAGPTVDPLAILQRIRKTPARPRPGERCDMCGELVADEHEHVVNTESRSLMCTCRGCWLLFTSGGAGGGKYRAVPDRYLDLGELSIAPGSWDALQIPVSVAFFFRNSTNGAVAGFYPSPAGATESLLPLDAWDRLVADNEVLGTLEADVEALLVRRDAQHRDAFLVPIDACYELVGELRRLWKGFDGGTEARQAMDAFFERLRERA
ncbi:MAG: hypothetical protein H0W25_13145 [Acidimicrobiia bacterium]|nr:hypothetical protein [Acidimicrobiia bacterium]